MNALACGFGDFEMVRVSSLTRIGDGRQICLLRICRREEGPYVTGGWATSVLVGWKQVADSRLDGVPQMMSPTPMTET